MGCCEGTENEIKFIKGDVLEIYFAVEDLEVEYIAKAYFSCIGAKILCELPYSEEQEAFCLRFPSKISDEVKPGFYTYDVTLELVDGSKITLLHNEDFIVLKKKNTLSEDAYVEDDESNDDDNMGENDNTEPTEPETPPDETESDNPMGDGDDEDNPLTPPDDSTETEPPLTEGGDDNGSE